MSAGGNPADFSKKIMAFRLWRKKLHFSHVILYIPRPDAGV
jgi:hypothetical protein